MEQALTAHDLRSRAARVRALLDRLPSLQGCADMTADQRLELHRRFRDESAGIGAELRRTAEWPATITEGPQGARVRMMTVMTTSTSGLASALRAWAAKAEARARSLDPTGAPDA